MYDASEEEITKVAQKLVFISNATYGSVDDPYLSRTSYNITFNITAGDTAISGAEVFLDGYGTDTTEADGKVTFHDVFPSDSIYYNVSAAGYEDYDNSLSLIDTALVRKVDMAREAYDVEFSITNGTIPLENATVTLSGYGQKETDVFGTAYYPDVIVKDSINYSVFRDNYYNTSGSISVTDTAIFKKVSLTQTTYNVTFNVTDKNEPLEDVIISFVTNDKSDVVDIMKDTMPDEFSTTGNGSWSVEQNTAFQGKYSFASGEIFDNQLTKLTLEKSTRKGTFSFYSKVSCEKTNDSLVFFIDGEKKDAWSGKQSWINNTYQVSQGKHTFEWIYAKDGSQSVGKDRAWIDYIVTPSSDTVRKSQKTDIKGETTFYGYPGDKQIIYRVYYESNNTIYQDTISHLSTDTVIDLNFDLKPELVATNFISPNGDGKNDYWKIYNIARYQDYTVKIFTANGEQVYSTTDYGNNQWDGTNHGDKLPDGIYYYVITSPNKEIVFKGIINLVH
jgi:gliding motility-associated-like protein